MSRERGQTFVNNKEKEMLVSIRHKQPSDNGRHFIGGINKEPLVQLCVQQTALGFIFMLSRTITIKSLTK
jgi:hypothetical protein